MASDSQGVQGRPGRLTIGVLGPVRAELDGNAVDLGGPAQRRVLAVLAAARGQVVSVDRLVDAVWDGEPVPSAVGSLQAYVSVLRKVLEPGRSAGAPAKVLVRNPPGYVLRIAAPDMDAEQFTAAATAGGQALARGEAEVAARELDLALGLWRGEAYADCADAEFVRSEVLRLQGLRIGAAEDRWDAALRLGEAARAVPELQVLVAEHPLRERAAALLATALYQQGRQADALEVLRVVRSRLVEELGIDPGPALVRLEAQLLAQDPALGAPVPVASALVAAQPAARSAAVPVRRVPRPRTSFVGRDKERGELDALLRQAQLVTVTGPAGVGKTRLAAEVARDRPDEDGPWFVELAGVTAAAGLPAEVAASLSLGDVTAADSLAAALVGRQTLLVLDNCEHLVGAVADLVELLLDTCPDLSVLATSREALDVPGELLLPLEPLPAGGEAVTLLRQRTAALLGDPDSDWRDDTLLTSLCLELDGLPLAIELAAAQCRVLSARQVTDMLDDRFRLLRMTRAGRAQHGTLEAAIAWSYDLLEPQQQQMFLALSVFRGPFDLVAAEAVIGDDALAALRVLLAKSLLSVVPGSSPRRYRMLQSLRDYAAARLPGCPTSVVAV